MKDYRDYILYERRTKIKYVAREIGFTPEHLYTVLNRKTKCGRKLAGALSDWSHGKFSPEEILAMSLD